MHTACALMYIYILFIIVLDTISIKEWIGADARDLNRAIFDGDHDRITRGKKREVVYDFWT